MLDDNYGRVLALNNDMTYESLFRIVQHEGNYLFESRGYRKNYIHCVGGDNYETTDVILAEGTENNSRFLIQKIE